MNAPALQTAAPELYRLLEEQFSLAELGSLLEEPDEDAVLLARNAMFDPLADLLLRPGKEVRARLVFHGYQISKRADSPKLPEQLPQLIEMLHTGSLVVDDIEDEATHRRGAPALHRLYGVPIALNAGNWMYFWPLHLLGAFSLPPSVTLHLYREISTTLLRCHHGQALDLGTRVDTLSQREIPNAVNLSTRLKTGSLMELAGRMGAIAARAPNHVINALGTFGREVGVALQTLDDIGSILSPARKDKAAEDLLGARLTWAWAFLAESLDEVTFRNLQKQASQLSPSTIGPYLETFREHLSPSLKQRPKQRIDQCVAELREVCGQSTAVDSLVRDVRILEQSYE